VGDLDFIGAGYKFAAIPEATRRLHSQNIYGTGNQAHDPTHHIVHSVKVHKVLVLKEWANIGFQG
jgi:hypothetical protein